MELSYDTLRNTIRSKGYVFFDSGQYNINVFGIRSNEPLVDEFNDHMGVAYLDDFGNETLLLFKATTKPGLHWLKNRLGNVNGTAILIPG
ncbi:MAG: hypothetical protein RIC06_12325 [Cyclobacteriaceae bacterium]